MKKFIQHLGIGLVLVLVFDFVVGKALEYAYFKQSSGFQYRTTHALETTEAEVLVFGSSRANHHYDAEVLENRLNKTVYNTGRDGQFILYQTALLAGILERYTPDHIIYDVAGSFAYQQEDYDRLSALLPYYSKHEAVREVVNLRSSYEPFKTLSHTYPYNSSLLHIGLGNMELNKKSNGDIQGYVPLHGSWLKEIDSIQTQRTYTLDSTKVQQFKKFIQLAKKNNIKLTMVYSPAFYLNSSDYSIELFKGICKEEKVLFYDFSNENEFITKKELFFDPMHLNNKGAEQFSNKLSEKILKHMSIIDNQELLSN